MNNLSLSKLGGQCLIAGGIVSFIPFLLQILIGGPPPDNVNIFSFFANTTAEGGSLSILYSIMSTFGIALVMYGVSNLNSFLQGQEKDPLLSLGTFLFLIGNFAIMIAWSIDPAIIIAKDSANIANMFISEMSMFCLFGPIAFLGSGLVSLVLAKKEFVNPIFMKISATIFFIVSLVFLYTVFKIADPNTHNSESTVMPLFACISIAQLFWVIWQLMVGMKMMKN